MLRLAFVSLVCLSACLLEEHGSGGPQCDILTGGDLPPKSGGSGLIAQQQQRNPQDLSCQSFGGPTCDPDCGPCPATELAPIPSWGVCGSSCEVEDEVSCAADPSCRVIKDARCAIDGNCATDFIGCFPTDQQQIADFDCARADAQTCSESSACTAFHRNDPCGFAADAPCPREFAMCLPEGQSPGHCFESVTCDAVGPACGPDETPGIRNGCFTGACIPQDLCEPVP
jgi:hypothetical protein